MLEQQLTRLSSPEYRLHYTGNPLREPLVLRCTLTWQGSPKDNMTHSKAACPAINKRGDPISAVAAEYLCRSSWHDSVGFIVACISHLHAEEPERKGEERNAAC